MNVLMVLASENFRDEEYSICERVLRQKNIMVLTASTTVDCVTGMFGLKVKPDINLATIQEFSFEGLMIIGGDGSKELWENQKLIQLVKEFHKNKKLIGAICLAPVVLANAGILRNKNATVHDSAIKELKSKKVNYRSESVVVDENIITGQGPAFSNLFAQTFANTLTRL